MKVIFDTLNIYYLPQYLPIHRVLQARGHNCEFVCYTEKNDVELCNRLFEQHAIEPRWVGNQLQASQYYVEQKAEWIIFGNTFYLFQAQMDLLGSPALPLRAQIQGR